MAATCEERGIKHVKDVFNKPMTSKSNSITFMARRPVAPLPPRQTSTGQSTLQKPTNTSKPATNGLTNAADKGMKTNGDANAPLSRGDYFLRAAKDNHVTAMELPVPAAPTQNGSRSSESSSQYENIYESVSPLPSPASPAVTTPVSPDPSPSYTTNIGTAPSPGYTTNIVNGTRKSSSTSSTGENTNSARPTKYPAPPPPVSKSSRAPKVPGYSKALASLQAPKSPGYSKQLNGNVTSSSSPGYDTSLDAEYSRGFPSTSTGSDSHVVKHVAQVHNTDTSSSTLPLDNASPVYERKFDFPSPVAVDNTDVGSLFSGYDTQDSPYTPPSPPTVTADNPGGIALVDNNNTTSMFKKKAQLDKANRSNGISNGNKRFSADETNSSLVASSGYFSENESDDRSTVVDRSRGHQNLNSSFDEDECTVDFIDDDDMYSNGQKYSLYQHYEGEDFAKYMDDDSDKLPQNTTSLVRKVQQRRRQQYLDKAPKPPKPTTQRSVSQQRAGLKQRLSQAFTFSRSERNRYVYQPQQLTKIHQFSFMDSKMGNYADEQEIQDYMSRDLETRSDIGGVAKQRHSSVPAWNNDTLSMSTLRKAKKLLDSRQNSFSNSVPNLHQPPDHVKLNNSHPDLSHKGESYSDFGADIKRKKKVNRFKFWKLFARKKDKSRTTTNDSASSVGFDEPQPQQQQVLQHDRIMDVRL